MSNQEVIRRREYCQFIKEIPGSELYLVVGIDIGKDRHRAFMGTATGICLFRKLVFSNDLEGFSRLLKTAEQMKIQHGLSKVVYGMEPTGNYHKPLGQYLIQRGITVVLVSAQAVKNNRQLLDGRWDKNDTKDGANIADLISRGRCQYYDLPCRGIIELRSLLSLRRRLKKEAHGIKVRIRNNLVAKYFPELDRFYSGCESETLRIVQWCLDPKMIAALQFGEFFHMVTTGCRGVAQSLRLRKIYDLSKQSVGCPMDAAGEYEADLLVEKLRGVGEQIKKTDELIEEICLEFDPYGYLLTICGFGPYVSATVLSAIGDPFRFKNRKQLLKSAGFDLCANRSGKRSDKAVAVISKKGNGQLRYALYQAANVAAARTDLFRVYFTSMLKGRERERGIKTKMRVKLAAKMLVIAWTLMKKQQPFDPAYINTD
ncbi:MAG: IS110 family transposase [Deltaproteobacteria bacterium]|nr:IS110 family transposase [Deltaproteobacteria bacterium]MBW2152274.1 IS110 family transposase [Deltaproteobacteria bacterium]